MSAEKTSECFVDTPLGRLYAKRWIPEKVTCNAPFVLMHDSLGSVDLWRNFPEQLADHLSREVIAYDRLGFGKSDFRTGLPSFNFIAEEATDYFPYLKQHFGFSQFILLGHSVGGSMALNVAAIDSDCQGVITLASQPYIEELTREGIRVVQADFQQPGQMKRLEKWHGAKASWVFTAWTDIWLDPDYGDWCLDECLAKVTCPVLAIHGENDEYGSVAFPDYIAAKTAGPSQKLVLKNCGHIPHREKTPEVLEAIKSFLC